MHPRTTLFAFRLVQTKASAVESSPFVLFGDSESAIDLENATAGNVVATRVVALSMSRFRRINSAIHLPCGA